MDDTQRVVTRRAHELLRWASTATELERARLVQALRPAPGDFDEVFVAGAAAGARASYGVAWRPRAFPFARPAETELVVAACPGGELVGPAGRQFPGRYQLIAHQLRPEPIWMCWEQTEPGETSGTVGEGLVALEGGRWIWLPHPWRHVSTLAADALAHWTA